MSISNFNMNIYRSPNDINSQFKSIINSVFNSINSQLNQREQEILNKVKSMEINLANQSMHIFEAPLDKLDFKDLVKQLIGHIIDELIDNASSNDVITSKESELLKKSLTQYASFEHIE